MFPLSDRPNRFSLYRTGTLHFSTHTVLTVYSFLYVLTVNFFYMYSAHSFFPVCTVLIFAIFY